MTVSNPLKQRLNDGETLLGTWNIIPSEVVLEIFGLGGMHFAILDMEHGLFDIRSLDSCVRACEASGALPLVRTPGIDASAIQWALDVGAYGVIAPQVNSATEATLLVEMTKYLPFGRRGFNPFTRAGLYGYSSSNQEGKLSNDFPLTSVIIESQAALGNIHDICNIEGLDVVYIGAYDLSIDLGCNGNSRDPRVIDSIYKAIDIIRAAGKAAGLMVSNREDIDKAVQIGANFLVYSVDTFIIHSAVKHAVSQLPILNR